MPRSLKNPKKAKRKNKGGAKKGEGSSSSSNGIPSIPLLTSRSAMILTGDSLLMDVGKFRKGNYRKKIDKRMEIQRKKRVYDLGSLPHFLLVFGGEIEPIDHRWNQHGLGGDNVKGSCRSLHSGPISLLHWSGKRKPWVKLDERNVHWIIFGNHMICVISRTNISP